MSPILMNAADRGYKIIRRSNSLQFMIYSIIMHYKYRVPPTFEQEYNLEILKEAKLLEFTLWVFIELANKVRVRV